MFLLEYQWISDTIMLIVINLNYMSIFNIKLKTKAGNDIKKKQNFTVFFRFNYKKGLKTTAEYTYRILYSDGVDDPQTVLAVKDTSTLLSREDFILKLILNFCHIVAKISQQKNIDPDFILFISPEFGQGKAWSFLRDSLRKKKVQSEMSPDELLASYPYVSYEEMWNEDRCKKTGINKFDLDKLKEFVDLNSNTSFNFIDPNRDADKYRKSLYICQSLQERLERKHEDLYRIEDKQSKPIES